MPTLVEANLGHGSGTAGIIFTTTVTVLTRLFKLKVPDCYLNNVPSQSLMWTWEADQM